MRRRRAFVVFLSSTVLLVLLGGAMPKLIQESTPQPKPLTSQQTADSTDSQLAQSDAQKVLEQLAVKGRAPKTGYSRDQFGNGWGKTNGCDTRNIILYRDLSSPVLQGECKVVSGTLNDPYTGKTIQFTKEKSDAVQIDHVVPLSNAWQTGAQNLTIEQRKQLANDPLELLAVDGEANQVKSDSDAATWLPKNKAFRCTYVARQIAVKQKYALWVTEAEKVAITDVLKSCGSQKLP